MPTRTAVLDHAARLLAASPTGEISTRAVCEAAGITQPVLYRQFGDKDGLLAAVVDHVWEQYLATKRAAPRSADPVDDLRAGWANHVAFARAHPHAYRLLFGTSLGTRPGAMAEAMGLLRGILDRIAAEGRLRLDPDRATTLVMAANSGLCLAMILRPDATPPGSDTALCDLIVGGLVDDATPADPVATAATTLRAHLPADPRFRVAEAALLDDWLTRFQTMPQEER
ncbi:TetR/AcrR family transcriptional regulator [Cellulomonas denverensis]|uniref:TetR/AcrR family transcriptional regulator n=1 Tax=Cellulomonas denverensis TaxID=264297 RepID=A0A7X6KVS8_9CELL|nr:TetR/AcrR family transcriptional regulator [Cellulomonas denverensis]NKY23217.1 TetR/AcrR family transcriptional regulator [Cellulomonas denverensis]GIG26335.1 TetR family transcriptional regulator [Cellulomonas denverensis]